MAHSLYHSSVHPFPAMARPDTTGVPHAQPNFLLRRVVALVVVFATMAVAVGIFILLAGLGGRPASASQAEPAFSPAAQVHVAEPGDSLWSIAKVHHGDIGLDRYVDALIDVNGGTDVQIGQAIRLP